MPIYDVQGPDGRIYSVEAPEGTPEDQVFAFVRSQMGQSAAQKPQEGIGAALTGGFKRFLSTGETALESLINPELAAQRGAERSEDIGRQYAPGASLEKVKQAYAEKGLFPAAKEAISQIPAALAEQSPQIAATLAGARAGAMAGSPLGPMGALAGGVAGAALPSLVQLYGANIERQFEEKAPEISRLSALGAAIPGAGLEVASQFIPMGRGLIGKLLGPTAEKALARGSNEAIERAAKESVASSLATGVATGALAEIPTEVAQQMLERLQAGLPLTDEAALKEYGEAAYGAGLVGGPFGAGARALGRPGARAEYEKLQQEEAQRLAVSDEELAKLFPEGVLPGGFRIQREELGTEMVPSGYSIMAEGRDEPLSVVNTEEEAQAKLESLTKIRQQESENLLKEEQKINSEVEKAKARLEQLEATEQAGSEEYQTLKAELPNMMEQSAEKLTELYNKAETLSKPLSVVPLQEVERAQEQFKVIAPTGTEFGVFNTLGEAESSVKQLFGEEEFQRKQEAQQRSRELYKQLVPQMRKFGLGDVGLKIAQELEGGAGGSYLNKLVQVSLEEGAPVQTMRHESLHALKDLGFFTPQQWKALEERAKKQWIKEHLEDQETEVNGERMSRLEGYRKLGYSEEAIIEEAIADAFGSYDKGVQPPPGMIAVLFKKLKNFFANLGQALRGAGFQSAEDIFQQVERGELKPAAAAETAEVKRSLPIVRGEEKPEFKGKPTVDAIGAYFDQQVKKKNKAALDYDNKKHFDRAVKTATEEVKHQIAQEKSGLDWYEDDVKDAFKQTEKFIPQLSDNKNRLLFSVMAGIMSPQTNARDNWFIAAKAFEHYADTGEIPGVNPESGNLWQGGTQSPNKKVQLDFLNRMVKDMGEEKALEWLFSDHTVKEINEFRQKYGNIKSGIDGKLGDMKPGLYAFGPKVGPFVSNLNGIHDVTVDKWMTRTFNRYFGTMLGPDGKISDAPTEPQRRAVKALVNEVAKNAGIKPYQVQSLLWFYEQQLFTKMGALSPSFGFSDGAAKYAESRGRGGAEGVSRAAAPTARQVKGEKREAARPEQPVERPSPRGKLSIQRGERGLAGAREIAPLADAPSVEGFHGPDPRIVAVAEKYAKDKGIDLKRQAQYVTVDEDRARRIAAEYERMEHNPQDPKVKEAYKDLINQTIDQYKALEDAGYKFWFIDPSNESNLDYLSSPWNAMRDIRANKEMGVYPTNEGFGNESNFSPEANPLLEKTGIRWPVGGPNGPLAPVLANDVFRAVHDAFGHGIEGAGFRARGEENAWQAHVRLFTGPAVGAITSETRGQNSWLNYGPHGDKNKTAKVEDTVFADQKTGLMPEWTWTEGRAGDMEKPVEGIVLGTKQPGASSFKGSHYGKVRVDQLDASKYGTGLRGAERRRLDQSFDDRIKNRVYFYIQKEDGTTPIPESGVGNFVYTQQFDNILAPGAEMSRLFREAGGDSNDFESAVIDAGYDGYAVPSMGMMVILNHNVPVNYVGPRAEVGTVKLSLKNVAFPSVKAAKEAVKNSQISTDTEAFKQYNAGNQWVDEEGKPKVFYHATAHNFFEFTPAGQSQAIFLADTPEEAETFGSIAEDRLRRQIYRALNKEDKLEFFQGVIDAELAKDKITKKEADTFMREAKRKIPEYGDFGDIEQQVYDALLDLSPTRMSIMPLYARAMSPFDFENKEHVDRVLNWVANNTKIPQDFPDKWLAGMKGRISQGLWQAIEDSRVQQAIRALGFDAFTVRENRASPKNYAVYQPQQVKSATGNDGQFSLETKDIRFSLSRVRYSPERFDNLWSQSMYTQAGAEKKAKAYLGFVDPMDFVKATTSDEMLKKLRDEQEPIDFSRMKELGPIGLQVSTDKDGNWKIIGHDGRHRMLALHEAGYRNVPVFMEFADGIDDAKSIPTKAIKGERPDTIDSYLLVADAEPLSFSNKDKAMEKFTRMESKVKYSLPSLSADTKTRMNEVAPQRYEPAWKDRVIGAFKQDFTGLRQRFLNRYEALAVYDRQLREQMRRAGGAELLADQSAEFAALQSDLAAGVAASSMGIGDRAGGVPVYRNGVTTIDTSVKGLVEALAPLARYGDPEVYQRYQFWAGWKRGRRLLREGKEQLYTPADAKLAQEIERAHPEFVQVQKDLVAYNNGIVNFAVQTGVLSKERAQVYTQYADYIPFYRQLDLDKTIGPNPFSGISGVKGPKKLKGGESPLGDFMENMVRNTQSMINAGMKNVAAQRATQVADKIGMIERMPGPVAGVGVDAYTVLENGQLVYYRAYDPLFIDALKSLNMPDLPFMGLLSAPANALRNLVTKDPGFMLANLLRDSLSSYVTSGQNVTPITGTLVNFGKALSGKDKNLQALFNAGVIGGYEFSQNVQQSGKSLSADLNKKAGQDSKLLRPFKSLWEGLEKGTTASDAATRMAIYERVMKDTGGNEAEAISRALEVMNFNRKGSSVLIRIATAALPFFNARLQGLDLFYRASTGRMDTQDAQEIKRRFWVRGMTMAALSAMYYMSVAGDDEYERQEEETKDNNWIFPSLGIRIPIPFEVGTLFKTIPERLTAYAIGNDTGKDLAESTVRALANTFAFNPIPQTFKPLVEVATNYNFFTMRPIVGQGMQEIEPKFQVGPGTSKVAEYLGGLLNVSPMKLDQLIKGYTGTMGGYVVDVVDSMASEFSDVPKASKRFEQMPIVKRFALDPEARGSVTQFYELQKSVDTFVRTANMLEKAAKPEEYAQYVQDNLGLLAVKDYVRDVENSMKELREMKKFVNGLSMPADEKRDLLIDLGRAETNLTANIKTIKKTVSQLK